MIIATRKDHLRESFARVHSSSALLAFSWFCKHRLFGEVCKTDIRPLAASYN